jgi:hypothetical protein
MAAFSVADAKNRLPSPIDKAFAGEEVIITRRGKCRRTPDCLARGGAGHWNSRVASRSNARPTGAELTSVEILDLIYESKED